MSIESGALIALDGRLVGYAAGIARYVEQLAEALAGLTGPERYLLIRSRRSRRYVGTRSLVAMTPPHHRLERWVLPAELLGRGAWPKLLHSPDHVAPAWGLWRSVVTLHDLAFILYPETHTLASRQYYAAAGPSARRAERVIAVSQRTASDAVRLLGVDPARIRVIHEAAAASFRPQPREPLDAVARRLGFEPDKPYILFVGTLEPRKNVPLLLDAVARVRKQLDVHLILVGARGWLEDSIYNAHRRSGVGEAAHFVGQLNEHDLAVLYSHASVFALPSVYEGFGLPVLEAMACGAPVVCSRAGPLPEVAGQAAVLLEPEDASTWAEALLNVLTRPQVAADLRERGFRRAKAFSWARAAQLTREVYREAVLA